MASIAFALCAAALYGSADFLGGLAARRSAVMPVMIFSQLAGSCMLIALLPWLRQTEQRVFGSVTAAVSAPYGADRARGRCVVVPITATRRARRRLVCCPRWRARYIGEPP